MNTNETTWAKGKFINSNGSAIDKQQLSSYPDTVTAIEEADKAISKMLAPAADYSNWPYPGGSHA